MKILGENKEGTKLLLGKEEAVIAFTKKGVEISAPQSFLHGDEDEFDHAITKNKSLSVFVELSHFLSQKEENTIEYQQWRKNYARELANN